MVIVDLISELWIGCVISMYRDFQIFIQLIMSLERLGAHPLHFYFGLVVSDGERHLVC